MEMSFQQYIDNPMGKRNAVFSQREMYRALYTEKFNKVFLREAGKINFTLYMDKKKDEYVIHIKIPSETVKNFYYDAVIKFYTDDVATKASNSLQNYKAKFFSNDPAFVFTYLRVFLKEDLFFEDMKPKSSKEALKKDPKEKNPYMIPGYSKILYFAFLFMKSKNLFSKVMYDSYAEPYNAKKLLSNVEHTDKKIAERQELGAEQAKEIAAQKKREAKENKNAVSKAPAHNTLNPSGGIVKTVKKVSPVNNVKKTSTIKTVKRTNKK